jgi:hypothetical protein
MFTVIKEVDGEKTSIITKQYEVGTYIIINNDPSLQMGTALDECPYHIKIRKAALKRNATIINGSIITGKFKENINSINYNTKLNKEER